MLINWAQEVMYFLLVISHNIIQSKCPKISYFSLPFMSPPSESHNSHSVHNSTFLLFVIIIYYLCLYYMYFGFGTLSSNLTRFYSLQTCLEWVKQSVFDTSPKYYKFWRQEQQTIFVTTFENISQMKHQLYATLCRLISAESLYMIRAPAPIIRSI